MTRAVHLKLLSDMSVEAFLAGFSRFCSRRGTPRVILFSDNGSNFVGANKKLELARKTLLSQTTADRLLHASVLCPVAVPHFGGPWEAE